MASEGLAGVVRRRTLPGQGHRGQGCVSGCEERQSQVEEREKVLRSQVPKQEESKPDNLYPEERNESD